MIIEKKHNYFYKITNTINNKYYYGVHSTNKDKYDYYLGSGKIIKQSIKKYGKENFIKEIIANYPTRREASDHEKLIVTMDLVLDENCYNVRTGGDAEYICSDEHRINIGNSSRGRRWSEETKQKKKIWATGRKHSNETRQYISDIKKGADNGFFGKTHTVEVRNRIRQAQSGENNVNAIKVTHIESGLCFGTKTDAKKYFKISDYTLDKQIKQGLFKTHR